DVLVDEAALMRLSESGRDVDGEAHEPPRFHGPAEEALERLAARVLEQKGGAALIAHKVKRSRRPGRVKLVLQPVFVRKAIDGGRRRMLRDGKRDQNRIEAAACGAASPAAERALAILPQDLQIPYLIGVNSKDRLN